MNVEERLLVLERRNLVLSWTVGIFGLGILWLLGCGGKVDVHPTARASAVIDKGVQDEIVARRFVLVNEKGNESAVLETDDGGAALSLYSSSFEGSVYISAHNGYSSLTLDAAESGTSIAMGVTGDASEIKVRGRAAGVECQSPDRYCDIFAGNTSHVLLGVKTVDYTQLEENLTDSLKKADKEASDAAYDKLLAAKKKRVSLNMMESGGGGLSIYNALDTEVVNLQANKANAGYVGVYDATEKPGESLSCR